MSMNLNIPITQTITLPDSWQACKTPQELSYWIIAKFDNFTTQFTEINNAMSSLQSMIETNTDDIATNDTEITEIKNTLSTINSDIETLQTDYNTLNEDLTTLYGLHQTLSNKVATMEDAVADLPTIKNDISVLQSSVTDNNESIDTINTSIDTINTSIDTINTENEGRDFHISKIQTRLAAKYYSNSTERIDVGNYLNMTTTVILNSSVDYRQFISVSRTVEHDDGISFIIYYNSDYNVTFGYIDSTISDRYNDITTAMESYSIDGNTTLEEVMSKTKVALRFYKTGSTGKFYSWSVL